MNVDRWQGRTWIQSQGNNAVAADYDMGVWTHLTLVYDDSQVCDYDLPIQIVSHELLH